MIRELVSADQPASLALLPEPAAPPFFFFLVLGHVQAVMVVIFSICGCTCPPSTAITLCVHSLCCRELIILQYDYTNKPVLCSRQLYSHRVSCSSILSLQVLLLLK